MATTAPNSSGAELNPVRVIGSIFRVRRDLTLLIKKHVLPGSGLTLEEADLLMDLYGAAKLGCTDPAADAQGYVPFASVKASLVHSAAALSRRVAGLEKQGLLETRKLHELVPGNKTDRRSLALRITPKGVERIEPVYERYAVVCERLLRDAATIDRRRLLEANESLMQKARWSL